MTVTDTTARTRVAGKQTSRRKAHHPAWGRSEMLTGDSAWGQALRSAT